MATKEKAIPLSTVMQAELASLLPEGQFHYSQARQILQDYAGITEGQVRTVLHNSPGISRERKGWYMKQPRERQAWEANGLPVDYGTTSAFGPMEIGEIENEISEAIRNAPTGMLVNTLFDIKTVLADRGINIKVKIKS